MKYLFCSNCVPCIALEVLSITRDIIIYTRLYMKRKNIGHFSEVSIVCSAFVLVLIAK